MKLYFAILIIIFTYIVWLFSFNMKQFSFIANRSSHSISELTAPRQSEFNFAYSTTEREMLAAGLVDIQKYDSNIIVDLKYATSDNITGIPLYHNFKRAFLQVPIAIKLVNAQNQLKQIDSSLTLVVFDATRPQSVQHQLWEWAKANNMEKYVASPWAGSNHNYGCAVDVSIMGKDSLLDMGTNYDHFGPETEPRYQWKLLHEGKLSPTQIENRLLLKKVMRSAGFRAIQTEWWHFNGMRKERARDYYKIIP